MNDILTIYYCEANYESVLACDPVWKNRGLPQEVKASDFVLATSDLEAKRTFCDWHRQYFNADAVRVEWRAFVCVDDLKRLNNGNTPKPVGDMAVFDYWEQRNQAGSVVA